MAALQPVCCWRPASSQKSPVMAGPGGVSFTSVGLGTTETGANLRSGCRKECNLAGGRNDSRGRRGRGFVVLARKGVGRSSQAPRPSTTRGPSSQQELSKNSSAVATKNSNKEPNREDDGGEDDEFDEDALEALFAQLEMDLEAGGVSDNDNEDLSEEEVTEFANELAAALRDMEEEDEQELRTIDVEAGEADTSLGFDQPVRDSISVHGNKGKSGEQNIAIEMKDEFSDAITQEYADEDDGQRVITLEPWQLRKLAAAVEIGRRKVNVKALSAEVGMDRSDVLAWLKNPPPELLMYSATMETEKNAGELSLKNGEAINSPPNLIQTGKQDVGPNAEGRPSWHGQKRLRKEHEATFERVFRNTDRPSNAIVQNLVELTHVPRKRIVEWFDQRRKSVRVSPKFQELR